MCVVNTKIERRLFVRKKSLVDIREEEGQENIARRNVLEGWPGSVQQACRPSERSVQGHNAVQGGSRGSLPTQANVGLMTMALRNLEYPQRRTNDEVEVMRTPNIVDIRLFRPETEKRMGL